MIEIWIAAITGLIGVFTVINCFFLILIERHLHCIAKHPEHHVHRD